MGSRLYNQQEVEQLLLNAGLRLARENHDFVLPFGLYRQLPGNVADVIRRLDASVGETPAGNQLSSVSYWNAQVR